MPGRTRLPSAFRGLALAPALILSMAAGPREPAATLVVDSPDRATNRELAINDVLFRVERPGQARDAAGRHSEVVTVLMQGNATPNPFMVEWLTGPVPRRHVRLLVADRTRPGSRSVIDLEEAEAEYDGGAMASQRGTQTLTFSAAHLTIDGLRIY